MQQPAAKVLCPFPSCGLLDCKVKIAIVGYGYLGKAYHKVFADAVIYDPFSDSELKADVVTEDGVISQFRVVKVKDISDKQEVNTADIAIVFVPTDPLPDGSLDMSIVEDVVDWLETPLILIKSALMPGTVDRLVEKTGKKIAVSVEYIGMGNYYLDPHDYPDPLDPQKHKLLVVGGETETAQACAEIIWAKMSPDTRIHLVTAREAEICKLIENFYGPLKVTFANCFKSLVDKSGQSFIRTHQAWSEDGRTDPMHTRVVTGKRGWKSHCYDKDVQALAIAAREVGALDMTYLAEVVVSLNKDHLDSNEV